MKTQTLALAILAVSVSSAAINAEEPRHMFLLIGQSNMAGRGAIEPQDAAPIDGAALWNIDRQKWVPAVAPFNLYSRHRKSVAMQRLNCGPSFVRAYQKANPGIEVGIVCAARGGTSIAQWKKGRKKPWPLYDTAIEATHAALADGSAVLKGILWHQGEANSSQWEAYETQLADLIANLRTDLDAPDVPFVFSQLGTWRPEYRAFNQRVIDYPQAMPRTLCIRTAELTNLDNAHFDSAGQRELGHRYANAIARLSAGSKGLTVTRSQKLKDTYLLPKSVQSNTFELTADIALEKVEGTAASVWFGNQLNLGFDGRDGNLFVEGTAIGRTTKSLGRTADFISAGKPFRFTANRDVSGKLTVLIDDAEVYSTDKLAGLPLDFRFRPRRTVMTLANLSLTGNQFGPEPSRLAVDTPIVPILVGNENEVARITLNIQQSMVLVDAKIDLSGTTNLGDVESVTLATANQQLTLLPANNPPVTKASIELAPGRHVLKLNVRIKPTANLRHTVRALLKALVFTDKDGQRFDVEPDEGHEVHDLRFATIIHRQGEHDCHTTRIPAISRTTDGSLLAVYDLRYNSRRDLQEHIDIGLSRSTDNGQTWKPPRPIMDMGEFGGKSQKENGCSDPNILVDRNTGEILVSAVWTHGKPNTHQWSGRGSEPGFALDQSSQFMMVRSSDDGVTWTKPKNLTRQLKNEAWWLFAPAPGNGITLQDGTLVMPTQGRDEKGFPFSNLMHSRDHGHTWTLSEPARDNTTECSVAELSDGSLMLNMRDNRNRDDKSKTNGRAISTTADFGQTWTKHKTDHGGLREPVCMASLISHRREDGQHVLVFSNPNSKTARERMTVQFSFDDGKTWPRKHHVLLDEPGGAYSSLVMIDDDTVGIVYESSKANLLYQSVPVPTIAQKQPPTAEPKAAMPLSNILFGSCIKQEQPAPIFKTIVAAKPELFIFLGDNIYGDTNDMSVLRAKYAKLSAIPGFEQLRASTRVIATWDDHDYGKNDAGVEFAKKVESQRIFADFWKEPKNSPLRTRPGIYAAHTFGPPGKRTQVIMLDTRYFRSALKKGERRVGGSWIPDDNPDKTVLGADQWKWLENQLKQPAEVRILATSIQAIAQDAGQETWSNLPRERERLFRLIRETKANGVLMISGDRHWSELSSVKDAAPYPLYDLTSSSLNQTHSRGTPTDNRFRALPTTYHKANFGAIRIDWEQADPAIQLEIRSDKNAVCFSQSLRLSQLNPK